MRLRTAIVLICLVLSLFGASYGAYSRFHIANEIITEEFYKNIENTAEFKKIEIENFIKSEEEKLIIFRTSPLFIDLLEMDKNEKQYNETLIEVKKRIDGLNKEIGFLDKEGILVVSENNPPGENYSRLVLNQDFNTKLSIYYNFFKKEYFITILSPMFEPETKEKIGFIGFEISLEKLNDLVVEGVDLKETGEVYLIDEGGILLTPSRFLNNSVFIQKVDTINSKNCFLKKENNFETFLNYRGEISLGTSKYISFGDWCLIVEIEEKELLDEVKDKLFLSNIFISIIIILSIVLFGFFIGDCLENIYLDNKKIYVNDILRKIFSKLNCRHYLILEIIFVMLYFFIITFFFRGWQQIKFFDVIPSLLIFVGAFIILNYSFKLKNLKAKKYVFLGAGIICLQKLIEFSLQEYEIMENVLNPFLNFFGFLFLLLGFREGVK